jgi:chromate transporter
MNDSDLTGSTDSCATPVHGVTSAIEVLRVFAWLGITCFGGPIAHLGYFRTEFVTRRRWLSERAYADLVGLCQFLPGPGSSKLGFSLGLMRAGYVGGIAAWVGFTLPSAIALVLFAYGAQALLGTLAGQGVLHGLKLVAVAIVAQAVWGMAQTLCPDRPRASIAAVSAAVVLLAPSSVGQIAAILLGAALGIPLCQTDGEAVPEPLRYRVSRSVGALALCIFALVLTLSFLPQGATVSAMFSAFFRSGALVFGGGHVVLPLLSQAVVAPGWVDPDSFLAGYGAAQAVPGPLFTFAAFLGATMSRPLGGPAGAALALLAIFLPGLLLQLGILPFWSALRGRRTIQAAMRGVNAAVVGVLVAALYSPVWTSAVHRAPDFAVALVGFVLLVIWKVKPILIVALCAFAGWALTLTV